MKIRRQYDNLEYTPDWECDGVANLDLPVEEQLKIGFSILTTQQKERALKSCTVNGVLDSLKASREIFVRSVHVVHNYDLEGDDISTGAEMWDHSRRDEKLVQLCQAAIMGDDKAAEGKIVKLGNSAGQSPLP